jgi:hypothetical protein
MGKYTEVQVIDQAILSLVSNKNIKVPSNSFLFFLFNSADVLESSYQFWCDCGCGTWNIN